MKLDVDIATLFLIKMNKDIYFMSLAIKQAIKAQQKGEVPVGAVIVYNDKIIAKAHNLKETKTSAIAHAEIIAINKACKKLNQKILVDATIYITLEPCLMCTGAIINSRMKRVVYATEEPKFGALGSLIDLSLIDKLNHRIIVSKGVLKEEASQLLKDFFKNLRR